MLNKMGPRIDPWGTLSFKIDCEDCFPPVEQIGIYF